MAGWLTATAMPAHVDLLLLHPPGVSPSDVARGLKGANSRVLRQRHPPARRWKVGPVARRTAGRRERGLGSVASLGD
jgi:REP element-mobilizing transposase RayT